jgi:hypothetical protein
MKIEIAVAPVRSEVKQAIEDAWVAILRAELEARASQRRDDAREALRNVTAPAVSR